MRIALGKTSLCAWAEGKRKSKKSPSSSPDAVESNHLEITIPDRRSAAADHLQKGYREWPWCPSFCSLFFFVFFFSNGHGVRDWAVPILLISIGTLWCEPNQSAYNNTVHILHHLPVARPDHRHVFCYAHTSHIASVSVTLLTRNQRPRGSPLLSSWPSKTSSVGICEPYRSGSLD